MLTAETTRNETLQKPPAYLRRMSANRISSPESSPKWDFEQIFTNGDEFFAELISAIASAKKSIELESYIFESDEIGQRVIAALCEAARRSVNVRVVVDALGSPVWKAAYSAELDKSGVKYDVFHEFIPSSKFRHALSKPTSWLHRLLGHLKNMNRRDHRKLVLIDDYIAFVGSMNISRVHLSSLSGDKVWRDTSAVVHGESAQVLRAGFERIWTPWSRRRFGTGLSLLRLPISLVRLNSTRRLRKRNYRDLLLRLRSAKKRIWITTPYFVPSSAVIRNLRHAARRGVDVRLLLPAKSDVFFMPWVASASLHALAGTGMRVFEYRPRVLHAKTLLVDDWAVLGSSNFNHRSMFHDLEADVILSSAASINRLAAQFEEDLGMSIELNGKNGSSAVLRFLGRSLLIFRNWL